MEKFVKGLVVVLLAAIGMSLTACGSDDEEDPKDSSGTPENELVGEWKVTRAKDWDEYVGRIFDFRDNGRMVMTIEEEYYLTGKWTIDNSHLVIDFGHELIWEGNSIL